MNKKMNRPYPWDVEHYSTESLSWDLENDFLNKSPLVLDWRGGRGAYIVKISGSISYFKQAIEEYGKTRTYMHPNVEVFSNSKSEVLVTI